MICDQETISGSATPRILQWLEEISNTISSARSSASPHSSIFEDGEQQNLIPKSADLSHLLKMTVKGQMILEYYKQNKHLDTKRQKYLTHCVVDRFVSKKIRMTYTDMKNWSLAIQDCFPTETAVIF